MKCNAKTFHHVALNKFQAEEAGNNRKKTHNEICRGLRMDKQEQRRQLRDKIKTRNPSTGPKQMDKNSAHMRRGGGDFCERDKTVDEVNQNKQVAMNDWKRDPRKTDEEDPERRSRNSERE